MNNIGATHTEPKKGYSYNFSELLTNGFLGIRSKVTLTKLCESGRIKSFDASFSGRDRQFRIKGEDVIEWLEKKNTKV